MNLKRKIDQRQVANLDILTIIEEAVMKYPDLRFGQILANLDVIQYQRDPASFDVIGIKDPFNEESVDMLTRVRNKIQNLDKNQNNHE